MGVNKNLISGSTTMLILKLLENEDMYGYQMIEELERKSDNTFSLKAGTLYPLLHKLEEQEMLTSYEENSETGRQRKYYGITKNGKEMLAKEEKEWNSYVSAINGVLKGEINYGTIF